MEKQLLISLIQENIKSGTITVEEIEKILKLSDDTQKGNIFTRNITNIFYIIGAVIVVIGAIILTAQYWDEIGLFGRLLVTLGISVVVYISALRMKGVEHRILSQVLFTISGVLMPLGVGVWLQEYKIEFDSLLQTLTAFSLFGIFLAAFLYTKRNILVLFNLAFATWGYFAIFAWLFDMNSDLAKWATMVLGIVYLCIAYYYDSQKSSNDSYEIKEKASVKNIIYGLGSIGVLAPSLFLGGLFDFLSIALIFGMFYLSTFVKSKATLLASALFLIIYIFKITSKYFADSVGWPIALILIGFLVIGVGYGTLYLNKKYINQEN